MLRLAAIPESVFVGQSVRFDGAAIFHSLEGVPMEKRIEMPVAEDFQMGFCTGLALMGRLPICIFPRFDFLLLCANQLVNHLDKAPYFGWHPKVIIRTVVGATSPLDAGPQHTQNHTKAFEAMLKTVAVCEAETPEDVRAAYAYAVVTARRPVLIIENERAKNLTG